MSNTKRKDIKKVVMYLLFILILIILLNGCIENPTDYCEKNDCTYCEKDSDCTAMPLFEKMHCCRSLINKHIALNVKSFNKKIELESRWLKWHCFFAECKGIALAPLTLPRVSCINNTCTPFSVVPEEICESNICMWNASWVKEHELPLEAFT